MKVDTQALRDFAALLLDRCPHQAVRCLACERGREEAKARLLAAAGTIDALRAVRDMEDFDAGWLAAEARFKRERDEARAEVARLHAEVEKAHRAYAMARGWELCVCEDCARARAALGEGTT